MLRDIDYRMALSYISAVSMLSLFPSPRVFAAANLPSCAPATSHPNVPPARHNRWYWTLRSGWSGVYVQIRGTPLPFQSGKRPPLSHIYAAALVRHRPCPPSFSDIPIILHLFRLRYHHPLASLLNSSSHHFPSSPCFFMKFSPTVLCYCCIYNDDVSVFPSSLPLPSSSPLTYLLPLSLSLRITVGSHSTPYNDVFNFPASPTPSSSYTPPFIRPESLICALRKPGYTVCYFRFNQGNTY